MFFENKFDIPNENHNSLESEHSDNIQYITPVAPQPRLLKEIRENEQMLKSSKTKFDDSNYLSSFESKIQFSSELKFPLGNTTSLKEDDEKSIEIHKKKIKKVHIENKNTILEVEEGPFKNLYGQPPETLYKGYKTNLKYKTQIEKKEEKKKMNSFSFFLSTIFIIKDFVDKLRNLSFLRSPSKLNEAQFSLIGDKTYIKEDHSNFKNGCVAQIFNGKFLILDPSKNFSIVLDFFVLLALSYYFLMIPLHFTYKTVAANFFKMNFDVIAFCILAFDIFRTFNTAFYLKGKLVFSRCKIAIEYMQKAFLFDCFSLAPALILIIDVYQNKFEYFLILFYLKIRNFKRIIAKLEQLLLTNEKFHHGFSLIKLIVWIIFTTHSFACIWNGIGLMGEEYFEKTWLKEKNLNHSNSFDQYLFSYYFVCVTMNTVGFGDIAPTNKLEVCFCIVFIFLACGIFAYSINSIGLILTDISKKHDEYHKDLNRINDYMKKKRISYDLRIRIRKYLEYIKKENKIHEDKQTGKTIEKLSDSLREELLLEANGSILKRINFFTYNFSEETLRKTMMIMKEKRFTPGDIIFEKGDLQESKLYIIKTGEIELLFGNSNHLKTVHTCKKGETCGEWTFFSGQEQKFSARSLDFTTAFAIDRNEFLSIITKVNKDFEKFNEIKEKLILYNDPSPLHSICFCCHSAHHKVDICPIIHYCPKKEVVIGKFLSSPFQERGDYKRKGDKLFNSFTTRTRNSTTAKLLQDDLLKLKKFSSHESEKESEKDEDEKDVVNGANDSGAMSSEDKIKSFESSESEEIKSENNNYYSLRISTNNIDAENIKSNLSNSLALKFKNNNQNIFFDIFDFDKLGFFSNYFPKNDVEPILKKIELKRVNFLKRRYRRKSVSFFHSNPSSQNFAKIYNIDEAFVQDGSIRINKKTMVNFNERKSKTFMRTATRQLNLKKKFFKKIEESPEEIRNYFRAKLKKNERFFNKKLKFMWKKIKICASKFLFKIKLIN